MEARWGLQGAVGDGFYALRKRRPHGVEHAGDDHDLRPNLEHHDFEVQVFVLGLVVVLDVHSAPIGTFICCDHFCGANQVNKGPKSRRESRAVRYPLRTDGVAKDL